MKRANPNWREGLNIGDEVVYQGHPYTIVAVDYGDRECELAPINENDSNEVVSIDELS